MSVFKRLNKELSNKILFIFLSLFFALFLWFQTSSEKIYEAEFKIPLYIKNVPSELVIINDVPGEVSVKLQGQGKNLLKFRTFSESDFTCSLDLSEIGIGSSNKYFLSEGNLSLPNDFPSIKIISITPKNLIINAEVKHNKKVKVSVDSLQIICRDGYVRVGDLNIEPSEIKIWGPLNDLRFIDTWQTRKTIIEDVDHTVDLELPLTPHAKKYITFSTEIVNVTQRIERLQQRKISNLTVKIINLPRKYKAEITPDNATIILSGPISYINRLSVGDIAVEISGNKFIEGNYSVNPEVKIPQKEIELVEISPSRFNIIVEKR